MADRSRSWDDRSQHFRCRTDSRRGRHRDLETTWRHGLDVVSRRVGSLLDSYWLGARVRRGRRYARQGQLLSLDVQSGMLVAQAVPRWRAPVSCR